MSERLLVGTRKGLFVYQRQRGGWRVAHRAFVGVSCPMALHDPRDGAIYAARGHGHFGIKLHRSRDGGATWTEITAPAFPPKPDDAPTVTCPMRGIEIPWTVEMIWELAIGAADTPGELWCGVIPGALFHSTDHGENWSLVESLWNDPIRTCWVGGGYDYPGIHSVLVDPRDGDRIRIGVSCGGVRESTDRGATWTTRADGMRAEYMPPELANDGDAQDPHIVVQCPAQPDVMWSQHHNGIFRTTDGAASWTEIGKAGPSTFGFAAAVHPNDGDTAWFVPATKDEARYPVDGRVVVTRTRDGGASFDVLGDGLPAADAYDIVYRHALAVDDAGERLAMGSTTGSVWTSDNQGDVWRHETAHLPPVYCVRFA